jgi:hypothetical protein
MASCYDLGDPDPLNANGLCHSRYKTECGRRLALEVGRLIGLKTHANSTTVGPSDPVAVLVKDGSSRSKYSVQVLILYSFCAHSVLILYAYCTHTVLILYSYSVQLTVSNGQGMHWNGTKQCVMCCGEHFSAVYPMQVLRTVVYPQYYLY